MDLKLRDRVLVVTGANRGIGRAIADSATEEGAIVVVVGRDENTCKETVSSLGQDRASFILCDIVNEDDVRRMVETTASRYGRIDGVVNNAGRFGGGPIAEVSAAALREGFDTKVAASLILVQAALPYLRLSDQARVVNVSGVTAHRIMPGAAVTALANSAMIALTAYLARELQPDNINCNCVIPGYTLTDPWRARVEDLARAENLSFEAAMAETLKRQDMGHSRWGTSREIADIVVFMLSAQASFLNGATFRLDGGQFLAVQR